MFRFKWPREYSVLFYLGLLIPSAIFVGFFMGYFVDRWFHTDPWGKLLGFGLGVFAGARNFYIEYKKLFEKKQ